MRTLKVVLFLTLIMGFCACDGSDGYITDEVTGTQYKFIEKGDGRVQGVGEVMLVQMENVWGDSVLMRTITKDGLAMSSEQGPPIITSVLKMSAVGDSVHIKMSLLDYSLATRSPLILSEDSTEMVIMKIRISNVVNEEEHSAKKKKEALKRAEDQKDIDQGIIQKYIADNKLDANPTDQGLYYVINNKGNGRKPNQGESVSVDYTLKLIDGTFIGSGNYKFTLGRRGQAIKGWDLGIGLITKGTKAKLLIPSDLAYGAERNGKIPPNAVLIYEVELVEIGE